MNRHYTAWLGEISAILESEDSLDLLKRFKEETLQAFFSAGESAEDAAQLIFESA